MADEMENEVIEAEQPAEEQEERTFTQAEVDALINKRIGRMKKDMPSDEEIKAYREWKKAQTPEQKSTTQDELDDALAEMEMTRRENYLLRKGADPEDVDYLVYRISKSMDGDEDFDEAADKYFKDHKKDSAVRMDTGARLSGNVKKNPHEAMNELIRNARK